MVKSFTLYQGQKHCEITHEPSGSKIETDAPRDNNGRGEAFSPTDLVGAALASCVLTTMAIVADRDGDLELKGAKAEVEKHMTENPRKIGELRLKVFLPARLTPNQRRKMEETAKHCPVHRSLHPDVKIPMEFIYV
jgi:uncharacterized OsmC-like protein